MSKSFVKFTFLLVPAVVAALALVVVGAGAFSQNANSSTSMMGQNGNTSMTDTQETGGGMNEDLSGNYTGTVMMSGGHELSGDAALSISGNTFTLESGGTTHRGRIYAVNTRRYIGAALYFEDLTDPVSQTPLAASVRVRRGRTFSMTSVPGARNRLRFTGRPTS